MADLTDTEKLNAQQIPGFFRRFRLGSVLKNMNLFFDLSRVYDVIEFMAAQPPLRWHKAHSKAFILECANAASCGVPDGYEEETLNVVTEDGIKTRTVLVKTADSADVETYTSTDERKLLQVKNVSGEYKLRIDKGYLVE
jgi:hypothetical protein